MKPFVGRDGLAVYVDDLRVTVADAYNRLLDDDASEAVLLLLGTLEDIFLNGSWRRLTGEHVTFLAKNVRQAASQTAFEFTHARNLIMSAKRAGIDIFPMFSSEPGEDG